MIYRARSVRDTTDVTITIALAKVLTINEQTNELNINFSLLG